MKKKELASAGRMTRFVGRLLPTLATLCIVSIPGVLSWVHHDILQWWGHVLIWVIYSLYWLFGWLFFSDDEYPPIEAVRTKSGFGKPVEPLEPHPRFSSPNVDVEARDQ